MRQSLVLVKSDRRVVRTAKRTCGCPRVVGYVPPRTKQGVLHITLIMATAVAMIVGGAAAVGVVRAEVDWRSRMTVEKVQAVDDVKCGGITYIAKLPTEKYPAAIPPYLPVPGGPR